MFDLYALKINDKLEREGIVVYGPNDREWYQNEKIPRPLRMKALLINIEPVEKCEHRREHVGVEVNLNTRIKYYKCKCGVEVIPNSFKEKK